MTFSSQVAALLDDVSNADVPQFDCSAAAALALGLALIEHDAYSQRAGSSSIHLDCHLSPAPVCCKIQASSGVHHMASYR